MSKNAKSDYLERKVLDHTLGTAAYTMPSKIYVALFTSDPGDDGSGTEVTGGSYARQQATFSAATTDGSGFSSAVTSGDVTFNDMPGVTVTHIALYDALTAGNILYHGELTSSRTVSGGDSFTINAGELSVADD